MDEHPGDPAATLPAGLRARLARSLAALPATWRVLSAQPRGRDWLVELTDASGDVVSQIVLLGERTYDETHGAQPRTGDDS